MAGKIKINLPGKTKVAEPPTIDKAFIEGAVHNFMDGIIHATSEGYRMPEFRASGFPFCPVLMSIATPYNEAASRSDFYFDTGTAIHSLVQRWASRAEYKAKLFGDWKCTGCQTKKSLCTKPKFCATCEEAGYTGEWQYEEIQVEWKTLSGHVDTVLKIAEDAFIVVDYKTTRFRFNGSPADRAKFPYGANVNQIEVYCTLLKELFGINIVGWVLVYIDRAQPMRGPRDYHVSSKTWTEKDHDGLLRVLRWANKGNIVAQRILKMRFEGVEPEYEDMEEVVQMRPCKSMKTWKAWMKPGFKYSEEQLDGVGICPHLETCISGDEKKIVKYFLKLATLID